MATLGVVNTLFSYSQTVTQIVEMKTENLLT